jgi:hypothetical protein
MQIMQCRIRIVRKDFPVNPPADSIFRPACPLSVWVISLSHCITMKSCSHASIPAGTVVALVVAIESFIFHGDFQQHHAAHCI